MIRRSGDWTQGLGRLAESGRLPKSLLIRRMRGFGFMGHLQTYSDVLVIATGADIGPVLLYLLDAPHPGLRCVWIGHRHRQSIGSGLVDRVLAGGQVTLVDTGTGRSDLSNVVATQTAGADAIFVVSNAAVRDQVARECNRIGVRWYGPTFDS